MCANRAPPSADGIDRLRDPAEQRPDRMSTQPFRDGEGGYALGRRELVE
jgi:hypothetical protein